MTKRYRMLVVWSVAALAAAGCVSERDALRERLQVQVAEDILAGRDQTPRVRMQAPGQATPPGFSSPPSETVKFRPSDPRTAPEAIGPGQERYLVNIRARVNGKPIFDDDLYNALRPEILRIQQTLAEPQRSEKIAELFNDALNKFIEEEVIYQDAIHKLEKNNPQALKKLREYVQKEFDKKVKDIKEKRNWTDADLAEQLKREGLTLETWQKKEEKQLIGMEYLRNRIHPEILKQINPGAIREYYELHKNEFQQVDKVKWQNIFIAVGPKRPTMAQARQFADELLERWRAGEEFARLLAFDDGDASLRKGEGVGQRKGEIKPPEVEDALLSLRSGDVGPPVEIATGIHLFKVVEREFAGQIPFSEEVQKTIRRKLQNDIARREEKRIIQELKARAVIEIIP